MRVLVLCIALSCSRAFAAAALPALDAEKQYTVSGVSAGAYMAVQFHVAHSAIVKGAGVIAGGPYYCAQGNVRAAYYGCRTPGWFTPLPSVALLKAHAEALSRTGRIDATTHLAGAPVWLFSGTNDHTVSRSVVDAARAFYASYKANTVLVGGEPAGHGMVTEDAGNACPTTAAPYVNDCDYDAAGELLAHLFGKLHPRQSATGKLLRFDQAPYGARDISMGDHGYVYVPKACEAQRCRVHVAFHGCRQTIDDIGERFVREAGYNRWAEANRLVVLYPQAIKRYWGIYNPRGCWDWWGYTGAAYATREGAQVSAVKAMLDRLSAPRR